MSLGKWFGISVSAHWSVLVLTFMAFNNVLSYLESATSGFNYSSLIITAFLTALGLLASILFHEFGHILVGRKFGVEFDSVILHIFGGAARMSGEIPNPKAEALMALAGPLTSFAIGILLFAGLLFGGLITELYPLVVLGVMVLASINFTLGVFNMIPAYPMDGGRVVRAGVWAWTKSFMKATKFSAVSGQILGGTFTGLGLLMAIGITVPFFGVGLSSGIWLGVIGVMVVMMATQEYNHYKKLGFR